jgi:hypothetical protein
MALNYKCTSVGCYSYQSPDTNTLFQRLQTLINQFAPVAVFDSIKVDGILGKGTTEKALIVLGYLGELDAGPVGAGATALEAGINGPDQLAANAQAVVDTLTLATKVSSTSAIGAQIAPPAPLPAPTPQPSAGQIATTTANAPAKTTSPATQSRINAIKLSKPALATSLLDSVPPWVAYIGGGLLAAGALAAVAIGMKKQRAKSSSPAVAGRWYR